YDRYGAQGGDWGAGISRDLGVIDADHVLGVHLNMLLTFQPADATDLTEEENARLARLGQYDAELAGYMKIQATRPQTLAYGLTDSPTGLLAWIVEKFKEWTDSAAVPEDAVDRDVILTNVTLYWLTATAGSSARIYYETVHATGLRRQEPSATPTGVAVFPADLFLPIRRFAELTNNIVQWSEFDRGGHFPAMEVPDLFTGDVRAFFRRLR
ncbi:MAG TPA: epoxide hydrolase, partial [Kribbellaceae bacterium]